MKLLYNGQLPTAFLCIFVLYKVFFSHMINELKPLRIFAIVVALHHYIAHECCARWQGTCHETIRTGAQ